MFTGACRSLSQKGVSFCWVFLRLQELECDVYGVSGPGLRTARESGKAGETPVWPGFGIQLLQEKSIKLK